MLGRNSDYVLIDQITTNYTLGEVSETTFEITVKGNPDMSKFKNLFLEPINPFEVLRIIYNSKKNCTTVHWADDTYTVVKLFDGDECDIFNAFCAAVCKRKYGSWSHFKKKVHDAYGNKLCDLEYHIVPITTSVDIYDSIDNIENLIKEKLVLMPIKKGESHDKGRSDRID